LNSKICGMVPPVGMSGLLKTKSVMFVHLL
jgi:hypothetical protein